MSGQEGLSEQVTFQEKPKRMNSTSLPASRKELCGRRAWRPQALGGRKCRAFEEQQRPTEGHHSLRVSDKQARDSLGGTVRTLVPMQREARSHCRA